MVFAPGALVFPGGAVDPADRELAEKLATGLPVDEVAARIAAIRETLEEVGLAIGFTTLPMTGTVAHLRAAMLAGAGFASALDDAGLSLDLDRLVPFARWQPDPKDRHKRTYDTRFYVVRLPDGEHQPSADATESVHMFWAGAQDVIDRCERGDGRIIFPTHRNLERLAQFGGYDEIASHACAVPVEKITPWIEEREDGRHLCIPDHLGYPVTSQRLPTIQRS